LTPAHGRVSYLMTPRRCWK